MQGTCNAPLANPALAVLPFHMERLHKVWVVDEPPQLFGRKGQLLVQKNNMVFVYILWLDWRCAGCPVIEVVRQSCFLDLETRLLTHFINKLISHQG